MWLRRGVRHVFLLGCGGRAGGGGRGRAALLTRTVILISNPRRQAGGLLGGLHTRRCPSRCRFTYGARRTRGTKVGTRGATLVTTRGPKWSSSSKSKPERKKIVMERDATARTYTPITKTLAFPPTEAPTAVFNREAGAGTKASRPRCRSPS